MYRVRKVTVFRVLDFFRVENILYRCGKDMAQKYDLQHWNNGHIKNFLIVALCFLKNDIFLVFDDNKPIATFQTKKCGDGLRLQKLATDPCFSGKGVGSFCLKTVEEMAKAADCKKVFFDVYDKSQHAAHFYENRGYTPCGSINTLKYTEVRMEKLLEK